MVIEAEPEEGLGEDEASEAEGAEVKEIEALGEEIAGEIAEELDEIIHRRTL